MLEETSNASESISRESTPEPPKPNKWKLEVDKDDIREISLEEMQNMLMPPDDQFQLSIDGMPRLSDVRSKANPEAGDFCHYFDRLSQFVKDQLARQDYTLTFRATGDGRTLGHPNDMEDYPNILIVREYSEGGPDDACLHWSHLEGTGMMYSGKSEQIASARAASCAAVHLQARPDFLMSFGILVKANYSKLFAVNACAVQLSPRIPWMDNNQYLSLLCAWMNRLYSPDVDPSLMINYTLSQSPTFTLVQDGKRYSRLVVLHAGDSIDKRTIIMHNPDSEEPVVVKEQCVWRSHRTKEENLLTKIHEKGPFPGVITLVPNSPSCDTGISVTAPMLDGSGKITKYKIRLLLNEKGRSLSRIKTPKEVLMALYDALEVSRILFNKRRVFHRDLSKNNILLQDNVAEYTGPIDHDLGDMCFSQYLLDERASDDDISSDASKRRRLATRLLLIDFDSGEDLDTVAASTQRSRSPVGTPAFMARRVRGEFTLPEVYRQPALPQLDGEIAERYRCLLPERLEAFPSTESELVVIEPRIKLVYDCYQLHFEAESTFWNLLYWCMMAQPAVEMDVRAELYPDGFEVALSYSQWLFLVSQEEDCRNQFINCGSLKRSLLHPAYSPLYELLHALRKQLQSDPEKSVNPLIQKPEYIHEAFQRLLIDFLVKNRDQAFMNLERSNLKREIQRSYFTVEGWWPMPRSSQFSTRSSALKPTAEHVSMGDVGDENENDTEFQRPVKRTKSSHDGTPSSDT